MIYRHPVGSPWLRIYVCYPSGGNFATSRLRCSTTIAWMSPGVVDSNTKTVPPILQDWTTPATSVKSEDVTAVPVYRTILSEIKTSSMRSVALYRDCYLAFLVFYRTRDSSELLLFIFNSGMPVMISSRLVLSICRC